MNARLDLDDDRGRGGGMAMRGLVCLLGGIILVGSVFCPIVHVPIVGNFNYIDRWPVAAALVGGAGVVALLLVAVDAVRWAWGPGYAALIVGGGTIYEFYARRFAIAGALGQRRPFHPLMRGLAGTVHLQWGLALVVMGGALVTIAAHLPADRPMAEPSDLRSCPVCADKIRQSAIKCRYCGFELLPTNEAH